VGHVSGIRGVEAGAALKGQAGLCFGGKGRRTLLTDRKGIDVTYALSFWEHRGGWKCGSWEEAKLRCRV
jgi:hypothetical protein